VGADETVTVAVTSDTDLGVGVELVLPPTELAVAVTVLDETNVAPMELTPTLCDWSVPRLLLVVVVFRPALCKRIDNGCP